jgi:para-aminobenzoate synthetase/4-amino-4-deoxychorismate lyase
LERYETLFQLTSTLKSRRRQATTMSEIFAALFPCGSVTGAPKVRTMQIISELELQPRGFYTGSIGFISPSGDAQFSVAIRTVCIDREKGRAEFGVGGGITHYSDGQQEFQECAVKSRVLVARRPEFSLLETMLHDPESGYFLYERHLDRLATSARYFGIKCDLLAVRRRLNQEVQAPMNGPHRVRLLVRPSGAMNVQVAALPEAKVKGPIGARLAVTPVDETDPFLFHKTTHRDVYERQLAAHPKCSEVLLWNTGGELTEFCTGNLVIELEGEKWTPPVASGLLAGTFRADLLENQDIRERVLYKEDVARAEQVYMINSVRKWAEIHLQR